MEDRTASLMTPAKLAQVKPKSAASPAAWLNQMAADAGYPHVERLTALREELEAQARTPWPLPLASALMALGTALPRLDFGLLQPRGWLARAMGRHRTAGAEFRRQFEEIEDVARQLATQVQTFQDSRRAQAPGFDRSVLELEVEFRAVDKVIDQGARWLEDMRNQLKAREVAELDAQGHRQLHDDAARCEILTARLKGLRRVSSGAQQAHQQAQAVSNGRSALLALLLQIVGAHLKGWQARVSSLASTASEGLAPASSLDAAMDTHREMQLCVKQAIADCSQLRALENAAAGSLGELGAQLQALNS